MGSGLAIRHEGSRGGRSSWLALIGNYDRKTWPRFDSWPRGHEGIALAHVAGVEPGAEPAHALGRGAMGEGLRRNVAL